LCSRLWLLKKHDEKLSYLLPEVDDLRKSQAGRWFQDAIALTPRCASTRRKARTDHSRLFVGFNRTA
jgi:hypothetical protein